MRNTLYPEFTSSRRKGNLLRGGMDLCRDKRARRGAGGVFFMDGIVQGIRPAIVERSEKLRRAFDE
jgi:hypothetical protein